MRGGRRQFSRQLATLAVATAGGSLISRSVWAAPTATASATLDTDQVRVGDGVQLTLSVRQRGGGPSVAPTLPAALADNFEIAGTSSGRNMSFGFGPGTSSGVSEQTTSLTIIPLKAGTFELGFVVDVDGETIESNVPVLTVAQGDSPTSSQAPAPGSVPTEPAGDIFVWATTDKPTVYVGEQLLYTLDVYERRQFLNVHLRKPPTFADFFSEELPQGEASIKNVGSIPYRVEPGIRRALFPQRAGTLSIGQAEISVGLRKRLASPELSVEVLPLPAEGQPAGFSPNNVGNYTISASVDRSEVDQGEPFTLTVTIEGTGNIKVIDPGAWPDVSGLRRYEPKVDTRVRTGTVMGGVRTYEFLMIPEANGPLTIPALTLAFFDPEQRAYADSKSTPLTIEVRGEGPGPQATASQAEPTVEDEAQLAEVITGDALTDAVPRTRWLTTTRWVYGMLAVPALAAVSLGGAALVRRFGPDERARARARDRMRRQIRVKAAQDALASGDGFHGTLSKLLHELAVRRAGVDGVGLARPQLLQLLEARAVQARDLQELRALLDACDEARFAAQTGTPEDRRVLLDRALELVRSSSLSKEGE